MQISHHARQQFLWTELSGPAFEPNIFHLYFISNSPPVQINTFISPPDISTKTQSCGFF